MSLFNQHWVTHGGEPVTGRVPTNLRVLSTPPGRVLNAQQWGAVCHAYKLFCDAVQGSAHPDGFHVQNRRYSDGMVLRMESLQGVHQVRVLIRAGDDDDGLGPDFLCVPTHYNTTNGVTNAWDNGVKWRNYPRRAPPVTPPNSAISASRHPGPTVWSSPHFLDTNGQRLILSWKGPPHRYQTNLNTYHCGWFYHYGGINCAYVTFGGPFTSITNSVDQLIDRTVVWFGLERKTLPVEKVIAASLHRPDPIHAPNSVVLRVCSNSYPQATTTRSMVVFDLISTAVPNVGASTLASLLEATTYQIVGTYPAPSSYSNAVRNNPGAAADGAWEEFSRPHFDENGARLALMVYTRVAVNQYGLAARSLLMPSWDVEEEVRCTQDFTQTAQATSSLAGSVYSFAQSFDSLAEHVAVGCPDYFGGQFVYLKATTLTEQEGSNSSTHNSATGAATGESETQSTVTWTLEHSAKGVVASTTFSASETANGSGLNVLTPGGTISIARTPARFPWRLVLADLSQDFVFVATDEEAGEPYAYENVAVVDALLEGDYYSVQTGLISHPFPAERLTPKAIFPSATVVGSDDAHKITAQDAGHVSISGVIRVHRYESVLYDGTPVVTTSSAPIAVELVNDWGAGLPLADGCAVSPSGEVAYIGFCNRLTTASFNAALRSDGRFYLMPNYRATQPFPPSGGRNTLLSPIFMPPQEAAQ